MLPHCVCESSRLERALDNLESRVECVVSSVDVETMTLELDALMVCVCACAALVRRAARTHMDMIGSCMCIRCTHL